MGNFAVPYNPPVPGPQYQATFGGITQNQPTLEGHLQQWLGQITHMTTLFLMNMGMTSPADFPAQALAVAESVCAEGSPPDCANSAMLAQLYGTMAELAYAQVPASQWNRNTFTATSSTPDVPVAVGPPSPITGIFGVAVGDGRLNLTNLTINQINSGALAQGAVVVNPADGKSYALTYALAMAGMGMDGFWTPVAAATAATLAAAAAKPEV
jgi:hypothetical protein